MGRWIASILPRYIKTLLIHVVFLGVLFTIVVIPQNYKSSIAPASSFYPKIHGIFEDYYLDLSIIREGRRELVEVDRYTTEESTPSRVHIFYLLLGRIAQMAGVSDIAIYYTGMYVSLLLFYVSVFLLVKVVIPKSFVWFTMIIIFFASPFPRAEISLLGQKIFIGTQWWTYMDILNRISLRPHHFFGVALLVLATATLILLYRRRNPVYLVSTILCTILSLLFSGIPGFIFLLLCAFLLVEGTGRHIVEKTNFLRDYKIQTVCMILLVSIPFAVFSYLEVNRGFPGNVIGRWEYQTFRKEQAGYTLQTYLQSFGVLIPFIALACITLLKKKREEVTIIALLFLLPLTCYALSVWGVLPINKIRFVYSAPYVYAGILSTIGVRYMLEKMQFLFSLLRGILPLVSSCHTPRVYRSIAIALIFFINILLGFTSYYLPQAKEKNLTINTYIPVSYMDAVSYLDKNTKPFSHVLSTFYTGVFIPAFSYNTVYIGHETSTRDFWRKWDEVNRFFEGKMSEQEAREFLKNNLIEYIYWDQGGEIYPQYASAVSPIYKNEAVTIYKTDVIVSK